MSRTIRICVFLVLASAASVMVGCANDRFMVGAAERWWADEFAEDAQEKSIMRLDARWSDDRQRRKAIYNRSIARAEEGFAEEHERDAYQNSVVRAAERIEEADEWQKLLRRFSISQAERDWALRAHYAGR